jgi:hypothetical protein
MHAAARRASASAVCRDEQINISIFDAAAPNGPDFSSLSLCNLYGRTDIGNRCEA